MIYDLAIVGGGPAGLSAAVTAKNRNLSTVLFDPGSFGLALQKGFPYHKLPWLSRHFRQGAHASLLGPCQKSRNGNRI